MNDYGWVSCKSCTLVFYDKDNKGVCPLCSVKVPWYVSAAAVVALTVTLAWLFKCL